MKKILKNRSGMALPLAIACIMIASVLVLGLLAYSSQSTLHYKNVQDNKKAHYLARTGVEAAMRAYTELAPEYKQGKVTRTRPIYQLADGSYTNDPAKVTAQNPATGKVVVEVTNSEEKTVKNNGVEQKFDAVVYRATATLLPDNTTGTATAYTVKTMDGSKNGWYDSQGKVTAATLAGMTPKTNDQGSMYVFNFVANLLLPYPRLPGDPNQFNTAARLQLDYDKDGKHQVAFMGNMVWVEPPVDLRLTRQMNGACNILLMAGRDLIFENNIDLTIRRTGLSIGGERLRRNLGTLLLSVPTYLAYTDPVSKEAMGKVYFKGDVTLSISTGLLPREERVKLFSAGDVYYFRVKPSNAGGSSDKPDQLFYIDLVQYYLSTHPTETNNKLYRSIYGEQKPYRADDMRKVDPTVNPKDTYADLAAPDPNGSAYAIWE